MGIITGGVVLSRLISTIGSRPQAPRELPAPTQPESGDSAQLRESIDDLSGRVARLEEERDFYKDLLDSPQTARGIPPPGKGDPPESGAA